MLKPMERARYRKRFAAIEASFRIEGMDPGGDAIYRAVKEKVLAGEMTPEEALAAVVEQSAPKRRRAAASA